MAAREHPDGKVPGAQNWGAEPPQHIPPAAEGEAPAPSRDKAPAAPLEPSTPRSSAAPRAGPAGNWDLLGHLPGQLGRGHGAPEVATVGLGGGRSSSVGSRCHPEHPKAAGGPWVPPSGQCHGPCHPLRRAGDTRQEGRGQRDRGASQRDQSGAWGHPRAPPEPSLGRVAMGVTGPAGRGGMCGSSGSRRSRRYPPGPAGRSRVPVLGCDDFPPPNPATTTPPRPPPAPPRGSPRPDISWRSFHASGLP